MRTSLRGLAAVFPLVAFPVARLNTARLVPADGYVFTIRTGVADANSAPATMTIKVAGDKIRLEADMGQLMGRGGAAGGANNPMAAMMTGAYMLPRDGKIVIVLPNLTVMGPNGVAMSIDPAAMGGQRGAGPGTDGSVDDLGAGETIAGHSTHKYRFKPATGDPSDVWLSTDIPGVDFKKIAANLSGGMGAMNPKMIAKLPNGFPLKIVGTSNGAPSTSWEVTSVEKMALDDAMFEVPAGMNVMDGAAMMGGMMGGRGGRGGRGGF